LRGFCLPDGGGRPRLAQNISRQNSGHENAGRTQRNSDSLWPRRHGRAKPHDASSSNCGRVFTQVAREPHFATANGAVPRQSRQSRQQAKNDTPPPPPIEPVIPRNRHKPLQVSWHSVSARHGHRRACTGMRQTFTKHGVPHVQECG